MAGRPQRRARLEAAGLPVPSGNGSRPPFERGNQAALQHGGYALLGIGDRATEIAADVRPTLPAYAAADEPVLLLLATTLARIERANAAIELVDENSTSALSEYLGGDEKTLAPDLSRLRQDLRAWIGLARRLANDLGLTPTSRARLGLDIASAQRAFSIVEYHRAREAAGLPPYDDAEEDDAA
jgi:hypothetical protein